MQTDKIKGYLNIAQKAGYLIIGGDKLDGYTKKLYLVLYDASAQKNTLKVLEKLASRGIMTMSVDNLGELTGIATCKIVALKNKNLSELIVGLLNS